MSADNNWEWLGLDDANIVAEQALSRCVGELRSFWCDLERAPRLTKLASKSAFNDLFSVDDMDFLISGQRLRPPALRLAKDGKSIDPSRYLTSARIGSVQLADFPDVESIVSEVSNGATLVLQGLHRFWPPLTRFCDALSIALSHRVQANAYVTPAESVGLGKHYDTHDVFVLQIAGRKSWTVWEPVIENPSPKQSWAEVATNDDCEPPAGTVTCKAVLEPGDALYVPRGFVHSTHSLDNTSVHLTLGVLATTWVDVMHDESSAIAASSAAMRGALPVGFASNRKSFEDVAASYNRLIDSVVSTQSKAQIEKMAEKFWAGRVIDLRGRLRDVLEAPTVDEATAVHRDSLTVLRLCCIADKVIIRTTDRDVTFPHHTLPTLRQLLNGHDWTARDLKSELDIPSRIILIRRLVVEGIMCATGRARQRA